MGRQLHEKRVEELLDLITEKKDLQKKVDSRLVYEIRNRNKRGLSMARKIYALFQAGLLVENEQYGK